MDNCLSNKVAIVSGSDSGIGAQIARELSALGATVVINYPFPSLRQRAESTLKTLSTPGLAVEADISTTVGPQKLVDETVVAYGKVDILVNNAGTAVNLALEEQTLEHWDRLVNLNGRGVFLLTKAVLPYLAPDSRIVNICSISCKEGTPLQTTLAGTKGMVDAFTRVWAHELPPKYHCTVNSVSPGPTNTEAFRAAGPDLMEIIRPEIERTPVAPRAAEPSEIAYAVLMLCLPRASWLNGVHLIASGGLYMC
ncbi:putative short chain dehydrogenase [Halenospora varia]|nr:putative short chain dehydrogenase [Halenospora varia]